MACHLAGVETAVATCGTAFGVEHIKVLRRIMRDEADLAPAKVIFTFDGDAAGQKAAMRAFADDAKWTSQSFVAVEKSGKDPVLACVRRVEIRRSSPDRGRRADVRVRRPHDDQAFRPRHRGGSRQGESGRRPHRRLDPGPVLRPEYTREVAGMLGVEVEQVAAEVARAGHHARPERVARATDDRSARAGTGGVDEVGEPTPDEAARTMPVPDRRDPIVLAERQLLQVLLQFPTVLRPGAIDLLSADAFSAEARRAVFDGIQDRERLR